MHTNVSTITVLPLWWTEFCLCPKTCTGKFIAVALFLIGKTTQMFVNQRMDKQNVIYTMQYNSAMKKNES